jgi:hypothetical protein
MPRGWMLVLLALAVIAAAFWAVALLGPDPEVRTIQEAVWPLTG